MFSAPLRRGRRAASRFFHQETAPSMRARCITCTTAWKFTRSRNISQWNLTSIASAAILSSRSCLRTGEDPQARLCCCFGTAMCQRRFPRTALAHLFTTIPSCNPWCAQQWKAGTRKRKAWPSLTRTLMFHAKRHHVPMKSSESQPLHCCGPS